MIDGHAVMKDTINCGSWEAVKTITSDPEMLKKLSDAKRKRSTFEHEDVRIVFPSRSVSSTDECNSSVWSARTEETFTNAPVVLDRFTESVLVIPRLISTL